ncbi:hypothetical protein [Photobacterium sanguinicancri]|nr:hypothetical protein [Photobacterium sanguinicancri]
MSKWVGAANQVLTLGNIFGVIKVHLAEYPPLTFFWLLITIKCDQ